MVKKDVEFLPDYPIRFDWEGIEALTEALNAPAFVDLDRVLHPKNVGPVQIRLILWAGMIHKHPELQKDDVKKLINQFVEENGMRELSTRINKALIASGLLGDAKQGADTGEVKEQLKS